MGDGQIGLAGASWPDTEDEFRLFQRPHIDILCRCAGGNGLLAGRNLGHRHLGFALHCRQGQLVICRDRHADCAFDVGKFGCATLQQALIEEIQSAAGLVGRNHVAGDRHRIAAWAGIDVELLLQQFQVLIELTE